MSRHDSIQSLSVRELLGSGARYLVPMYQRNYAWEEGEITQLIVDVLDYLSGDHNYYIGTLVVFEHRERRHFEVIDGQQRLTTLSLLVAYLQNRLGAGHVSLGSVLKPCLDFECRPTSRAALSAIFREGTEFHSQLEDFAVESAEGSSASHAIEAGYRIIERVLPQKLGERSVKEEKFAHYLIGRVHILRVGVPRGTESPRVL